MQLITPQPSVVRAQKRSKRTQRRLKMLRRFIIEEATAQGLVVEPLMREDGKHERKRTLLVNETKCGIFNTRNRITSPLTGGTYSRLAIYEDRLFQFTVAIIVQEHRDQRQVWIIPSSVLCKLLIGKRATMYLPTGPETHSNRSPIINWWEYAGAWNILR